MKDYSYSNFFLVVLLSMLVASCQTQKEVVDLKFTTELVQADLDKMQSDMKDRGINLNYEFLDFDESGHLKQISASIKYSDGQKYSFESRVLTAGDGPGFYRDFSED
eukprot:CAMPEP_0119076376 /NCGR_PEP_ID=MMETSP1178-20130426/86307_1 /TAXON_ID=33656 /ORGANISM="unid sp, Strain CCMP2000" /LENGTH=106 /DNA_ID=CAMNT_0007058647 /DNA_START=39 /DNA_END=359 /DNA_ORIENTATION=-